MKLPKESKSARRRAARRAKRDLAALRQERARAALEKQLTRDQVDPAAPSPERAVAHLYAPSTSMLPPAGALVSDSCGNELIVV